jgi:hypothetical protein
MDKGIYLYGLCGEGHYTWIVPSSKRDSISISSFFCFFHRLIEREREAAEYTTF